MDMDMEDSMVIITDMATLVITLVFMEGIMEVRAFMAVIMEDYIIADITFPTVIIRLPMGDSQNQAIFPQAGIVLLAALVLQEGIHTCTEPVPHLAEDLPEPQRRFQIREEPLRQELILSSKQSVR